MIHHEINQSPDTSDADVDNVLSFHHVSQASAATQPHGPVPSPNKVKVNVHKCYVFARTNKRKQHLVDWGANGRLAGSDIHVLEHTGRKINNVGIDHHEFINLNVATAAAVLQTSKGRIIGIFHEYAHLIPGQTLHSPAQLEWFKIQVDHKSDLVDGQQRILECNILPLTFKDGLPCLTSLSAPTDHGLDPYPHVLFDAPTTWDPSVLDNDFLQPNDSWQEQSQPNDPLH